jgi:antitoxin MazE
MTTTVAKWGNSYAVRIPAKYLKEMGITANSEVRIELNGSILTIEAVEPMRRRGTRKPLSYYLDQLPGDGRDDETRTGPARGREVAE